MPDLLCDRIYQLLSNRQRRAAEITDSFALGSIIGSVRTINEDIVAALDYRYVDILTSHFRVALVCDGIGGMLEGRKAALTAASHFLSHIVYHHFSIRPEILLEHALQRAHSGVFDVLDGDGGATLSAVYINDEGSVWIAHVGDSRIYTIDYDNQIKQISRNDTIGAALNREDERRPDFARLIQFVGMDGEVEPQITRLDTLETAGFLITSDGVHGAPSEVMSKVVRYAKSPGDLIRKMLSVADALGGLDNASAVHLATSGLNGRGKPSQMPNPSASIATLTCPSGTHDIFILNQNARLEADRGIEHQATWNKEPSKEAEKFLLPGMLNNRRKKKSAKRDALTPRDDFPADVEKPVAQIDFQDEGEDKS